MNANRLLTMALLISVLAVSAQQRAQSLRVEILGAKSAFGIHCDGVSRVMMALAICHVRKAAA